jgi:hypothetical protein
MRPTVAAGPDFTNWWGDLERNGGVRSALSRFAELSISVLSKSQYSELIKHAVNAGELDKHLFEHWLKSRPRVAVVGSQDVSFCDIDINSFNRENFPLDACLSSDQFREVLAFRENPLTAQDTAELFFRRKFNHALWLSGDVTIVDRYFCVNVLKSGSGAQFFLKNALSLGVNLNVWTSNPGVRKVNYDTEELSTKLRAIFREHSVPNSSLVVQSAGTHNVPLMHDRMGYIKFYKGRLYFKLGAGLEIFAESNFRRKSFHPASLEVSVPDSGFDRYIVELSSQKATNKIVDTNS